MAKVSVVVPVYNAEKHLEECVCSVLRQSESEIELLLIDDGSDDGSGEICDSFAARDRRVKVVHQTNQGSFAARRKGVRLCTGEYTCFCDADDIMPQEALKKLLASAQCVPGDNIAVGIFNRVVNRFTFSGRHTARCFQIQEPKIYNRTQFVKELYCSWFGFPDLPVSLVGKLYPTGLLRESMEKVLPITHFFCDDMVVTLDLMPRAEHVILLPEVVYSYRPGGGTSKFQPHMMDDWISQYNYKAVYALRYPMPQDVELLMDVELCNMTFTYLTMCASSRGFNDERLLELIERVRYLPEVTKASHNGRIDISRAVHARLLREGTPAEILAKIKPTVRQKLRKLLMGIIYHLA